MILNKMDGSPNTIDFKIRIISPWAKSIRIGSTLFDSNIESSEADALLCYWAPHEELFEFDGPKAWYCCEPEIAFNPLDKKCWLAIRSRLAEHEFLFHNHNELNCRVPHITHFQRIEVNNNQDRLDRAVTVVSNFGGGLRRRHPEISYRNRFITHSCVDLFGRSSWNDYRKGWLSRPASPKNYQGEIPGDWPASEKRDLLSKYKVCLCLENMTEPHYFTEKFVEAVAAGCIPIYQAHSSLVDTVLRGAMWVDPADYNHDPKQTIEAALMGDIEAFREANLGWLNSPELKATSHMEVFNKLSHILNRYET